MDRNAAQAEVDDGIGARVSDVKIALAVKGHAGGPIESRNEGGDDAPRRHLANRVAKNVGDVEVSQTVESQTKGMIESRSEGGNGTTRGHLAHRIRKFIGDIEIALGIERQTNRHRDRCELGDTALGRYPVYGVAAKLRSVKIALGIEGQAGIAAAGEKGCRTLGCHPEQIAVGGVGDEEIALRVEGQTNGDA